MQEVKPSSHQGITAQTFFSILYLPHDLLPLCRLRCRGNAKRALPGESGSVGVEGCGDPALLLSLLFSLQTGGERTTHSVTEPLSLKEAV